jgi:O-succinylbenzoic acid--CoA ligase
VRVVTTYGMSETSGGCVYDGVPLDGVRVRSTADGCGSAGPVVARGYRLRPDLTAAPSPATSSPPATSGGSTRGVLTVLGRADDVVVSGGRRSRRGGRGGLAPHPAVGGGGRGVPGPEWGRAWSRRRPAPAG